MSAERSQWGLPSLLPMSCRGRAEELARHLQTRLRSLGADATRSWSIADAQRSPNSIHTQSEAEIFYDSQLECESPPSPADEEQLAFSEVELGEQLDCLDTRLRRNDSQEQILRIGSIDFTSSATPPTSPLETQSRDNGLYSAITFDECHKRNIDSSDRFNCSDEVDCAPKRSLNLVTVVDSGTELSENAEGTPKEETTSHEDDVEFNFIHPLLDLQFREDPVQLVEVDTRKKVTDEVLSNAVEVPRSRSSSLEIPTIHSFHAEVECGLDDKLQRVRRCSSLKAEKTPPGTPGHKKIVRFADALGLDLADVRTFMDEIPVVPKSAYVDLLNADFGASSRVNPRTEIALGLGDKFLQAMFQKSIDAPNSNDCLTMRYVCLETDTLTPPAPLAGAALAEGAALAVGGYVRVRNLDFHKTVHVRYTIDGWRTYSDRQATYVEGSCDGFSDRFQFVIYTPSIRVGQNLELAVRFQCKGCQYWDNNSGANYCYQCMARALD